MIRAISALTLLLSGCVFTDLNELPAFEDMDASPDVIHMPEPDLQDEGPDAPPDLPVDCTNADDCAAGFDCEAGQCVCAENKVVCFGVCAEPGPTRCGDSCEICFVPPGGIATCEEGTCGFECPEGTIFFGGSCVTFGQTCPTDLPPLAGNCNVVSQVGCASSNFYCATSLGTTQISCMNNAECDSDVCRMPAEKCQGIVGGCTPEFAPCHSINNPCPASLTCNSATFRCTGCENNADCPPNQICQQGVCFGPRINTLLRGEVCTNDSRRCAPGLICQGGICEKFCDIETAAGCAPNEFCSLPAGRESVGICTSEC